MKIQAARVLSVLCLDDNEQSHLNISPRASEEYPFYKGKSIADIETNSCLKEKADINFSPFPGVIP